MPNNKSQGLSLNQRFVKRTFDIFLAIIGLGFTWWIIVLSYIMAAIDTQMGGFFIQKRIGCQGSLIPVIKIRTMRNDLSYQTSVTTANDPRQTRLGRLFRKTKIDELPQFINVLFGHMSIVGPRPDVSGFADQLTGDDRIILTVRPGITGPATLNFHNEEELLTQYEDSERYNREVIFPKKVKLNREYVENYSFWNDVKYIANTILALFKSSSNLNRFFT